MTTHGFHKAPTEILEGKATSPCPESFNCRLHACKLPHTACKQRHCRSCRGKGAPVAEARIAQPSATMVLRVARFVGFQVQGMGKGRGKGEIIHSAGSSISTTAHRLFAAVEAYSSPAHEIASL